MREALGKVAGSADEVAAAGHRRTRDTLLQAIGRLDERAAVLEVAAGHHTGVEALLRARARALSSVHVDAPKPTLTVEDGLQITDPRVLALLGAAATTGISNAMRHSEASRITIQLTSSAQGRMRLQIANDGADASRATRGRGLRHLDHKAWEVGATMTSAGDDVGDWVLEVTGPRAPVVDLGGNLTTESMIALTERALRASTRLCAAMIAIFCVEGAVLPESSRRRTRALSGIALCAYEILDARGYLSSSSEDRFDVPGWFLGATAVVSACSPHYENSLWSGWANSALSRYGLRAEQDTLAKLTAAHAVAILVSHRGGWRSALTMASHELPILVLGPAMITWGASKALAKLDRDERELQRSLSEIAQLHELAESFHTSHPVTDCLEQLETDLREYPDDAALLRRARREMSDAAHALPAGHNASDFANQFAAALAARLWPAEVDLERDDATLSKLDEASVVAIDFRRPALAVADRLGDHLAAQFPVDWLARPTLRSVLLRVMADDLTDTIFVQAVPQGLNSEASTTATELQAALNELGGVVDDGYADGRVTVRLPMERHRTGYRPDPKGPTAV